MAPAHDGIESDASMRARLVKSLSNSFPGSALSKALHFMDGDAIVVGNDSRLSSSCFAELRLDGSAPGDAAPVVVDDDLTDLEWLQSHDLLKNIETGDRSLCTSPMADDLQKENDFLGSRTRPPPQVPYNPQRHVKSKPPYSFSCLIFMAIEESPAKRLPVKDIYDWVQVNFPYFRNAPTGWKNSVRHNLSLNKCFMKVEKDRIQGIGKGSYWCVDPNFRPNLLQALRRTPYHPYHQMQMVSNGNTHTSLGNQFHGLRNSFNEPSPHLFPFLSQRLSQTKVTDSCDIDVANALVQLKRSAICSRRPLHCVNGWDGRSRSPSPSDCVAERDKRTLRRKLRASRCRSPVVCTTNPSGDHTYSLTDDQIQEALLLSPSSSSVDEDYNFMSDVDDFDDDFDDEEEDMDSCLSNGKTGKGVVEDARRRSASEENQSRNENETAEKRVIVHQKNNIVTRSMTSRLRRKCPEVEDEEKKTREGADALLDLAGLVCRLNVVQQVSAPAAKMKGSKKRTGLRIRLRKRSCRKASPRTKSATCNNSYNNNSNNDDKNGNRKSNGKKNNSRIGNNNKIRRNNNNSIKNDVNEETVQVKLEAEDYLFVKVKEERIDDE